MAGFRSALAGRFSPAKLFRPASVAVIGAHTPDGAQMLANLQGGGYTGRILPVAPGVEAVSGLPAWAEIASLPATPDLAIMCDDPGRLATQLNELGGCGTHAAVVVGIAGGLRALARSTGVRLLGPGSFGVSAPGIGLNAIRSHLLPRRGRIALVSQSAALCRAVLDWAEPNGVGFSQIVGIGGNEDIGFGVVLDWLSRDADTGAILLDIRRIKDSRQFLSAARAAARLRPTVAIRAGGRLMDPSGQADAALEAALRRCGVLSVVGHEDFLAAAETLTRSRPARGERLAIVSNAIGPGQLAADAALREGLSLASLDAAATQVLRLAVPSAAGVAARPDATRGGDLIYVGPDEPIRLAEAAALLGGAREVDAVLVVHAPTGPADNVAFEALAAAAAAAKRPLLVCAMGETTGAIHRRRLAEAGMPVFATPEGAVRGFLHLVHDRHNRAAARELPPSKVLQLAPDQERARQAFAQARSAGRASLAQDEAMEVLAAYGVPIVPSLPAFDPEEAAQAALRLGLPVVLKHRRFTRPDPRALGGTVLDLRSAGQVRDAAKLLELQRGPEDEPGFLVQHQVGRARQLMVRVGEDALFGPTISFGQGGTAAEFLQDLAVDLPPLNLPLAHALIARTRVAATLGPLREQPAADVEAVADTLVRISQLLVDFPEIAQLEVNPLFADAAGVLAGDAWIRLRGADEPLAPLAISPYPAELVGSYDARGERLIIRPIRPEDAEAHAALFRRFTPEDIRYRFFTTLRELSPEQVTRMTQVDYDREIAFIAVREATEETVGVARLVREMESPEGEFAVAVQPDMKGRGVARHLVNRLIDWARAKGMTGIFGEILADNQPMLAFARSLGFTLTRLPNEDGVIEARLTLV